MPKPISISELSLLTGKTREMIGKALTGLWREDGAKGAKLYDSREALETLYGRRFVNPDGEDGPEERIDEAESRRLLNLARRKEIELDMEIKRKDRIPLESLNEINDDVAQAIAATIKGSKLTEDDINEVLAALREIPARLKWIL